MQSYMPISNTIRIWTPPLRTEKMSKCRMWGSNIKSLEHKISEITHITSFLTIIRTTKTKQNGGILVTQIREFCLEKQTTFLYDRVLTRRCRYSKLFLFVVPGRVYLAQNLARYQETPFCYTSRLMKINLMDDNLLFFLFLLQSVDVFYGHKLLHRLLILLIPLRTHHT